MGKDAIFISWDTQRETSAEEKRREPLPRPDFVWLIALDLSLDDLLYPVGIIDKNAGVEE